MRISPITSNFGVFRNSQNKQAENKNTAVKYNTRPTTFTGVEYNANYNKAMSELVEDSNRYAYHTDDVNERKYILSKYSNTPVLYEKLAFNNNVRYYDLVRGQNYCSADNPHWERYSALDHVVHEGDLTGTYLLFENAPNQKIKDKLGTTLLNSYLSFLKCDVERPVFYTDEAYRHKGVKEFEDNPFVVVAAVKHMSKECKNQNIDKINKAFYGINYNAGVLKGRVESDKWQDFIKAGYEILNEMPANTARNMIKGLSEDMPSVRYPIKYFGGDMDIRPEYNQYIDALS